MVISQINTNLHFALLWEFDGIQNLESTSEHNTVLFRFDWYKNDKKGFHDQVPNSVHGFVRF